ncbi:hypothetical protein AB0J14_05030 [Micromonospora arborensis]|uniref:hypothetical protein n=1 Tax=Micromonospora arborensis TaxID=2116518 RepID=UPI0033DE7250
MGQTAKPSLTDDDLLAALVAGGGTDRQIADRLGWTEPPVYGLQLFNLRQRLLGLVGDDLAYMRWQFRRLGVDYLPTKKGRERAAQVAVNAAAARLRATNVQ